MITIERHLPIPDPRMGRRPTLPFQGMSVGDSFFTTDPTASTKAAYYKRKLGFSFVSRTQTENGVRGVRLWRTE